MTKLIRIFIIFIISTVYIYGQADYRITGTIRDNKNNPLADVKITLKNKESGRTIVLKTKKDGTYEHAFIPHAVYTVTFEKEGYKTETTEWDLSRWEQTQIVVNKDITLISMQDYQQMQMEKEAQKDYEKAYEALSKNDCATAEKYAKKVVEKFNQHFPSYFIIGRCNALTGKTDVAIENYKKVIELKPDLFEAYFDLAELYFNAGNSDLAIENFKKAAELKQDDPEVFYNLGALYFKSGKIDEAKANCEKALQIKPDHSLANKVMGYIYVNKGDFQKAIEHLQKYLEITPNASDKKDIEDLINTLNTEVQKANK